MDIKILLFLAETVPLVSALRERGLLLTIPHTTNTVSAVTEQVLKVKKCTHNLTIAYAHAQDHIYMHYFNSTL